MSDVELLVLVPWLIFAVGVAAIVVLALSRTGRVGRLTRRRGKASHGEADKTGISHFWKI